MLSPKKQKFRKLFRGKNRGNTTRGTNIDFGEFAMKSVDRGMVSAAQIEAARKAISHFTKREGKVWLRIFPHKPVTAKAAGERLGAGKGDVKGFVAVVSPGRIIFELSGVSKEIAFTAFERAAAKLSIKTKFLAK